MKVMRCMTIMDIVLGSGTQTRLETKTPLQLVKFGPEKKLAPIVEAAGTAVAVPRVSDKGYDLDGAEVAG
jgi:hypothetical protein